MYIELYIHQHCPDHVLIMVMYDDDDDDDTDSYHFGNDG